MKKTSILAALFLVLGLMAGSSFAQIDYLQDFLEPGNPGGRTTSLKTWDAVNPVPVAPGNQFTVDIWAADLPESIISGGFSMTFDPAQVSIVSVEAYDNVDIAGGPWDGSGTFKIPEPSGPGTYILGLVQLSCAIPDTGGDIILAKVTFQCLAGGTAPIAVTAIPDFDTTVGCASGINYDPQMGTNTLTVTQEGGGCQNNAECDDGIFCNGAETCNTGTGECQPGTPVDCNDGVACTTDSCNEATNSCDHIPNNAACDDGIYCNGAEVCDPVNGCEPGTPVDCNDGVACTTDSCNEATNSCDHIPNNAACDDGIYCNGAEVCDPVNGCEPGTPVNCPDDGLFCTGTESCDEASNSCVNSGNPCPEGTICNEDANSCDVVGCTSDQDCDDGLYCNGQETCLAGTCQSGTPVNCPDDGLFCTGTESCDEASNSCVSSGNPCPEGTVCNEDTNTCDALGCTSDQDCDDGLYCNGVETCDTGSGICLPGTPVNCDDGIACTTDSCNEATNSCDHIPDNAACDDGIYCNGTEVCDPVGGCMAGTPPDCSDAVACTDDSCNEDFDICEHIPNDANCPDDGIFCNGTEYCDPINDCASTGDPCPAGFQCNEETDSCDPVSGITVSVDIDPYACPNPVNLESTGKVRVTILGTNTFNVTAIDQATILLSREGVAGAVAPHVFDSFMDRSTPFTGELCGCADCPSKTTTYNTSGGVPPPDGSNVKDNCGTDGYVDLSAYFKISELANVLKLHEVSGQTVPLTLTGKLLDGTDISGKDCILVQGNCKGDFDCDGDVDGKDTHSIKTKFGWSASDGTAGDAGTSSGDFDDDGDIDATDINGFISIFGSQYEGPCAFVECKGDFDCDRDVDGTDAKKFGTNFGRNKYYNPCTDGNPCVSDFDADSDCDGSDAAAFKGDFGRGMLRSPCRGCVIQ